MALKPNAIVDISKPGAQLQNLTGTWNARVLDGFTPFVVQFEDNGMPMNLNGLQGFIEGSIGEGEPGTDGKIVMGADATPVRYTDDGSGNTNSGIVVFRLPQQFFIKEGIFLGYIGLQNSSGVRVTSKDVWFQVLGAAYTMGVACNYFNNDFNKALAEAKGKIADALDDLYAKYNQKAGQAETGLDNIQSAITAIRNMQTSLSNQLKTNQELIDTNAIVTKPTFDNKLKSISDAINERLKNFKAAPQPIANLSTLQGTYPNGTDGIFVTMDNQHMYMWLNSTWQDGGVYQAQALSGDIQQKINDTASVVLKDNLIKNGSFSTGSTAPAIATGTTPAKLSVVNFSNRNWLSITSSEEISYGGAAWRIPVKGLGFPLHFEADIGTNDDAYINFYLVGLDAQGSGIGDAQWLYNFHNENGAISHVSFDFNLSPSFANAESIELRIQEPDKRIIHGFNITGINLHSLYTADRTYSDNLLAHRISNGSLYNFSVSGNHTTASKEIININSKNWLRITTDEGSYNGLEISNIPNPYKKFGHNVPFHFEFNLLNYAPDMTAMIYLVGYNQNTIQPAQSLKKVFLKYDHITHCVVDFEMDDSLKDVDTLSIRIQHIQSATLNNWNFADLDLRYINYRNSSNDQDNLLQSYDLNGQSVAFPSGKGTTAKMVSLGDKDWVQASNSDSQPFGGASFFSRAIDPYQTFYFEALVRTTDAMNLNVYVVGLDDNGNQLGTAEDAILSKSLTTTPGTNTIIKSSFKLPIIYQSATYLRIAIQQPDTKPITALNVTDAVLKYDSAIKANNNLIPVGKYSRNSLVAANTSTGRELLSLVEFSNQTWLEINDTQEKAWSGITFKTFKVDTSKDMYFETDVATTNVTNISIYVVGLDSTGAKMGTNADVQFIECITTSGDNQVFHVKSRFKVADVFKDASSLTFRIQQPDAKALSSLKVKDPILKYVTENTNIENYGLPVVKVYGDLSGMTKENAKEVTYEYENGGTKISGYAKIKWQGNSSTLYDKKGFRLQPYEDGTYSKKKKVQFLPQWSPTKKINLKAYYTDGLLSRDPVNANIGADIASTNASLPYDLRNEDNFGFIDGFPIVLMFNSTFQGIYSFNTARSDFDYAKYAIMGNGGTNVTNFTSTKKEDVKLDGSDFESLMPEDEPTDDEKSAVGDLVTWVSTSSDDDFKAHFEEHLDLNTTIDYFILTNLLDSTDSFIKNQIFITWDGKKWYMQAYDLDSTLGIAWNGKEFDLATGVIGTHNNLFKRFNQLFTPEISKRYIELRTWLTPAYVLDKYKQRINQIGVSNYQREYAKWNNPSKDTATYKQLKNAVVHQFKYLDQVWLNQVDSTKNS